MDDNRFTCPTPIPIFIRSSRISVGLNAVWWILNNRRMASVNPGLEVSELFDYWQDYPPTHVLVAGCLLGGNRKMAQKATLQAGLGAVSMNYHRRCIWPVDALAKNYHLFIKCSVGHCHQLLVGIGIRCLCLLFDFFLYNESIVGYDLCLFKP